MLTKPIRQTLVDCYAHAASGHAAAELLRSAMNSRRLMGLTPGPWITELSISAVGVGQWRAAQLKGRPMTGLGHRSRPLMSVLPRPPTGAAYLWRIFKA